MYNNFASTAVEDCISSFSIAWQRASSITRGL